MMKGAFTAVVTLILLVLGTQIGVAQKRPGTVQKKDEAGGKKVDGNAMVIALVFTENGNTGNKAQKKKSDSLRVSKDSARYFLLRPHKKPETDLDSLLKRVSDDICKIIREDVPKSGATMSIWHTALTEKDYKESECADAWRQWRDLSSCVVSRLEQKDSSPTTLEMSDNDIPNFTHVGVFILDDGLMYCEEMQLESTSIPVPNSAGTDQELCEALDFIADPASWKATE